MLNVLSEDNDGITPLDIAERKRKIDVFYEMINSQSHMTDEDINRLIRLGVEEKKIGMVSTLIENFPIHFEMFLKKYLQNCYFQKFWEGFRFFCRLEQMNNDILMDLYRSRPEILEWLDFTSVCWRDDSKMEFLLAVSEENPDQFLTLRSHGTVSWRYSLDFLGRLLDSKIPIKSLKCSVEGSALASLINVRCFDFGRYDLYDDMILELISRGVDVNDDSPMGKPLNHYIYMFSAYIGKNGDVAERKNLLIFEALLEQYEKKESLTGMALNPTMAEKLHHGATGRKMEEYMQTALGSTLIFDCASRYLYDQVKVVVDLSEVNAYRRNFVHQLAFLERCFEYDLKGLFIKRGFSVDAMKNFINLQDSDGMTPLMYAMRNPDFFQQLLECGADINVTDKRGFSVVHHLLIHGTDAVIKKFLEKKGTSFLSDECGASLKLKLGVEMSDCLTLGVSFLDQLKELYYPRKNWVGHRKSATPGLDLLSTYLRRFSVSFKKGIYLLLEEAGVDEDFAEMGVGSDFQGEEERKDKDARILLSTGIVSWFYDGLAFVTETYALLNPFHVCEAYGRYAPDFFTFSSCTKCSFGWI